MKKPKKTPRMYTPWGERAEITQRAYDGHYQLDVFMIPPYLSDLWYEHKSTTGEVPEWVNQGRWVVTHVSRNLDELLSEVEYR